MNIVTRFYAEWHNKFRRYPVHIWRLGTYGTHFSVLIVGEMFDVTISFRGRHYFLVKSGWLP